MASLEDIVRKRRSNLVEGERRQFSVARFEAVEKMRKFALEDPRYYLLELIQSAVANGSGFISIDLFRIDRNSDDLKMRWTGPGFARMEMLNLFDVLLEAEGDSGRADIQMFARAINAMLLFEPDRLLLASGSRGREGVTCEVRGGGSEIVELRNSSFFDGVHIFASGLVDSRLPREEHPEKGLQFVEKKLIRERCIMPKVSVMFNGREISHITWTMHDRDVHTNDVLHIDEDDLHGEIWLSPPLKESAFDLMTYGVKIDRVYNDVGPFAGASGAVVFNKLRKTADHANIVRDENYDRLWARLRPYAELLHGRREDVGYDVARPGTGNRPLHPEELLEELVATDRVLMIAPDVDANLNRRQTAREVAESIDARLLVAEPDQDPVVQLLAGEQLDIVRSHLSESEVAFFLSEPVGPPPRPWLVEATRPQSLPVEDFAVRAAEDGGLDGDATRAFREALGTRGQVNLRVYTPEALGDGDESLDRRWVRVLTCERQVWSGGVETAYPGHMLYVDVPASTPSSLLRELQRADGSTATVAEVVGEHAVRIARDELESATTSALQALRRASVSPGSHGSRIALHALGRQTVLSLSPRDGRLRYSMLSSEPDRSLLDVPLFETLAGETIDGHAIEAMLEVGLLPVVRDEGITADAVAPVDPSEVIVLDDEQERLLIHIVGGDAIARLDVDLGAADTLESPVARLMADAPSALAPEFARLSPPEQEAVISKLLSQARLTGNDWGAQEGRRRARRLLLLYLVHARVQEDSPVFDGALDAPIVPTQSGRPTTMRAVFSVIDSEGFVTMFDGRSPDVIAPISSANEPVEPPFELTMDPYLAALLRRLDGVRGPQDSTVVEEDIERDTLARIAIESSTIRGFLAVPARATPEPLVTLVDRDSGRARGLRRQARRFGVVGTLAVELGGGGEFDVQAARHQIEHHARSLLEEQMLHMSDADPAEQQRRLEVLLEYTNHFVRLSQDDQGTVDFDIIDDLALRILELPLFPTTRGVPVSGLRLLREFCRAQSVGEALFLELSDRTPGPARSWVERHLDAAAIYREPHQPPRALDVDVDGDLVDQLERTFEELDLTEHPGGAIELRCWPRDREHLVGLYGFNRGTAEQISSGDRVFVFIEGQDVSAATLVAAHPMLERVQEMDPRERLSWLMLSAYSCINEARAEVLNEHELAFQRRLAARLLADDDETQDMSTSEGDRT